MIAHDFSSRFKFSDWPNREIPAVAAGVYVIWHEEALIYCGMSGREVEKAVVAERLRYGLYNRLNSHASGRLSGDQFCVYLANRIIIPSLNHEDLVKFASGEFTLDYLTKRHIRDHYEYQYAVVESSRAAFQLERLCQSGEVFGVKPLLNPL